MRRQLLCASLVLGAFFCGHGVYAGEPEYKVELTGKAVSGTEAQFTLVVSGLPKSEVKFDVLRLRSGYGHCFAELETVDVPLVSKETTLPWRVRDAGCHNIWLSPMSSAAYLKNGTWSFKLSFKSAGVVLPLAKFSLNYALKFERNNVLQISRADVDWMLDARGEIPQIPLMFRPEKERKDSVYARANLGESLKFTVQTLPSFAGLTYRFVADDEDPGEDKQRREELEELRVKAADMAAYLKNATGLINAKGKIELLPELDLSRVPREVQKEWRGRSVLIKLVLYRDTGEEVAVSRSILVSLI